MDTKRFELILERANIIGQLETDFIYWREVDRNQERSGVRARVQYVVAKVFSVLEPMELEALEELKKELIEARVAVQEKRDKQMSEKTNEMQATISLGGRIKGLQQAIDIVSQVSIKKQEGGAR